MQTAIPQTTNLCITALILTVLLAALLAMPVLIPENRVAMIAIAVLSIPLNTPFWSLIHEAVHRNFHGQRRVNEFAGRSMSILFGASFHVLRFGHLMHHQYNREWESEHFDVGKKTRISAWAGHYFKMLGGLYLIEVVMSFTVALTPLPYTKRITKLIFEDERHYNAVMRALLKPDNLRKIRIDCAGIALFYGAVFILYGANWIVPFIFLTGRAVIVSVMDNAYHYGTPVDNSVAAKELSAPGWMARFILNFNFHLTHHQNPSLPWTALAASHDSRGTAFTEPLNTALLAQFRGPLDKDKA